MNYKKGNKVRIKPYEEVTNHLGIDKRDWDKLKDTYTLKADIGENSNFYEPESGWIIPNEALVKVEDVKPSFKVGDKCKISNFSGVYTISSIDCDTNTVRFKELSYTYRMSQITKVEEITTFTTPPTTTLKYKVGDIVQIKSLDWYNANKNANNVISILDYKESFTEYKAKFCGKKCTIKAIINENKYILLETPTFSWEDYMFEDSIIKSKRIKEDPYPIGSTFTSNGNTYIVEENPRENCKGCDLFTEGECHLDRPEDFYCVNTKRSDNKYVIAKKVNSDNQENSLEPYPVGKIIILKGNSYQITESPTSATCPYCEYYKKVGRCETAKFDKDFHCAASLRKDGKHIYLKEVTSNPIFINDDKNDLIYVSKTAQIGPVHDPRQKLEIKGTTKPSITLNIKNINLKI